MGRLAGRRPCPGAPDRADNRAPDLVVHVEPQPQIPAAGLLFPLVCGPIDLLRPSGHGVAEFKVAAFATVISATLGTLAALALARSKVVGPLRRFVLHVAPGRALDCHRPRHPHLSQHSRLSVFADDIDCRPRGGVRSLCSAHDDRQPRSARPATDGGLAKSWRQRRRAVSTWSSCR